MKENLFRHLILICINATLSYSSYAQSSCLKFNEICVANIDAHIDPSYNYGGWVELYNPTSDYVALYNMCLRHTDSEGVVEQHTLSSSHGNVVPMGYKVLWFDHNSKDGNFGPNASRQIPFKLDADGGVIELLSANGEMLDVIEYPKAIARSSYLRSQVAGSSWGWTAIPTPGASNDGSPIADGRVETPQTSSKGGVFADSYTFSVDIPEGASLYYTTDGSTPLPLISQKSSDGLFHGNSTTIYRFVLTKEGMLNSPVVTRTFIKSDKDYYLPVLNVSTHPDNLYDDMIGIYVRGKNGTTGNNSGTKANINMDWERPVNVEYFTPDEKGTYSECINQEAAMSIFGGWTRFNTGFQDDWEYKPSFKLKSSKVFEGENTFAYSIFDSKPFIKIKNFLVRNGGQDKFYRLKDPFYQELIRTSGLYVDCQAYQPAHIFLNGKYLGMMNLREESNKQFAFSNYGVDTDRMDQWEGDIIIKAGDQQKLNEWYDLSVRLAGNPTDTTIWNQICDLVDIDEYCNYMAAEIYLGNLDWLRGGFRNIKGFRAKEDNGKFHIVLHDLDGCYFGYTDMILQVMRKGTGSLPKRFCNMLKYAPFRKQFIDAYCLMNGSVFDPVRCRPILMEMNDKVTKALQFEGMNAIERTEGIYTSISDEEVRRPALKKSLIEAFDLHEEYDVSLSSSLSNARLLLNGQEVPGGKFNGYLFDPVVLTCFAPDGYRFAGWSVNGEIACTDSVFTLGRQHRDGHLEITANYKLDEDNACPPIRINEISSANDIYINDYGKKSDWIELYNTTDEDFDLSGIYVSDNIEKKKKYQIVSTGVDTTIPAHGYKIVWCDGKSPISQLHTSFKLENADSACVCIMAEDESWTDSICYLAQPRWQTFGRYPDGGCSLALFDRPTICNPNNICTSTTIAGTPSGPNNNNGIINSHHNRQVVDIEYYNLKGQRISNPETEHIVIQRKIYTDGSYNSRKVVIK